MRCWVCRLLRAQLTFAAPISARCALADTPDRLSLTRMASRRCEATQTERAQTQHPSASLSAHGSCFGCVHHARWHSCCGC